MKKYLLGIFRNIFRRSVSIFALTDQESHIDKKAHIARGCKLMMSSVDKYSYVGPNTVLAHANIGRYCSISTNCQIGLARHSLIFLSTSPIFTSPCNGTGHKWCSENIFQEYVQTVIGNDVWIGSNVIIIGGASIGDGAVIGAGAVVTKDVPPYAIVGGVPARVIRYRFDKRIIGKLLDLKWWNASENRLKANMTYFQHINISTEKLDELDKLINE